MSNGGTGTNDITKRIGRYLLIVLIPILAGLLIRFYIKNIGFVDDKPCKSLENNLRDKQYPVTAASLVLLWALLSKLVSLKRKSSFYEESFKTALAFSPFLILALSLMHCRLDLNYLVYRCMMAFALGLSISILITLFFSPKSEIIGAQASWTILIIVMAFYMVVFYYYSIVEYEQGATNALDFASRVNMIWNTAHGRFLYRSLYQNCFLRSHFSPILASLVPIYWTSFPIYLQTIITKLLAIGVAVPLFLLAKKKTSDNFLSLSLAMAVLFAALYQSGTYSDLYAVHFEPIIIVLIFYFMEKEKWVLYGIFGALLLTTMEDKFIPLMMIGTYLFFFKKKRVTGASTIIAAALAGSLVNLWIMPIYKTRGSVHSEHFVHYAWLGRNLFQIVRTVFTRPFYVLGCIFNSERLPTMFFVFTPLLFLPLISGGVILAMLPAFLGMFISAYSNQYQLWGHYALAPITFAVVATIYAAAKTCSGKTRLPLLPKNPTEFISRRIALFLGCYILISGLYMSKFVTHSFLNILAKPIAFSSEDGEIVFRKKIEREIPADAQIWASDSLCTHFAQRTYIDIFSAKTEKKVNAIVGIAGEGIDSNLFIAVDTNCIKFNAAPYKGILILLRSEFFEVYDFYGNRFVVFKAGKPTIKNDHYIAHCWTYIEAENIADENYSTIVGDAIASDHGACISSSSAAKGKCFVCGPGLRYLAGEYKANFYLKISNPQNGSVAEIDAATDDENKIITSKTIECSDFAEKDVYLPFALSFTLDEVTYLDFRVKYLGNADLFADKIIITSPALTELRKKNSE